jgi:hypothetical protein
VKALSDCIVTSGNAVKIVEHAPKDRPLLFVPDENLGAWVMEQTGRPMTLWKGNCYVHVEWTHAVITRIRREHPDAPLIAHPECTRAVRLLADKGFPGLGVNSLAAAAGVDKQLIYYHFGGLEGVVRELSSPDTPARRRASRLAQEPGASRETGLVWLEGEHLCQALLARGGRDPVAEEALALRQRSVAMLTTPSAIRPEWERLAFTVGGVLLERLLRRRP